MLFSCVMKNSMDLAKACSTGLYLGVIDVVLTG